MKKYNGSRIMLECLKHHGLVDIFGYPGGQIIPFYNELYDFEGINHFIVRHEQAASHAADAYARVSGKIGVCVATSGPGATNLVTGIMTAYMDSVPMIAITGQVPVSSLGKDAFQETDILGITMPITKYNYLLKDVKDIPLVVKEAIHIASTGRPGPVLIDFPKNIQVEEITEKEFEKLMHKEFQLSCYSPNYFGHPKQIKNAALMINKAERPLIIAGAGVLKSKASDLLMQLAEIAQIPVTTTLLGLGCFPSEHPLSLNMLGMHGTAYANIAVNETDLILAIGIRFDDRITGMIEKFCPHAKIIHIDIDPAEISKNKIATIPIVGDITNVLKELLPELQVENHSEWINYVKNLKIKYPNKYDENAEEILPQEVIEVLNTCTDENTIICTDVGQHQMWTAMFYNFRNPDSFCSSGGAGTMGYGIPSTIGAQVAFPNKKIIGIIGDGGFQMTIQELITIKQYNLPIKLIIINNSYLGMVRQWQELFFNKRYSSVDLSINPDFQKIAEAYGLKSVKIEDKKTFKHELEYHIKTNEATIIEVIVKKEENVLPMIPVGKSVDNMMIFK